MCLAVTAQAATYYVATNGLDTNPGTQGQPFLTVQKGVDTAQAGDTVLVAAGTYAENVTAARSGSAGSPITIDGQGVATVHSFLTTKQYNNFINFTLAGKASSWWFWMGKGAHHCIVSNNIFDAAYNTNSGILLQWDWPSVPTEVPFGGDCASGCLVISNTFKRGIGNTLVTVYGDTNTVFGNRLLDSDACDWFRVWGRSNSIVANLCSNLFVSGLENNHPDFFQSFGRVYSGGGYVISAGAYNILVESNLVVDCYGDAQICMLEAQDNPDFSNFTFRNNVFVRVGSKGTAVCRDVYWYNNTFVECATNVVASPYPLIFTKNFTNEEISAAHGARVFNNIFLNCGEVGNTNNGWPFFWDYLTNVASDYNFISKVNYSAVRPDVSQRTVGAGGGWDPYYWWEDHGVNGGNPAFSDENNLNFTIGSGSPLVGAGTNLTSFFTTDLAGFTRPASGGWAIGTYAPVSSLDLPCPLEPKIVRAYSFQNGSSICLYWQTNQYRTQIEVYRRLYTNNPAYWNNWTGLHTNTATATAAGSYCDTGVGAGTNYEYRITTLVTNWICAGDTNRPTWSHEYIVTGMDAPLVDTRGKLLLLVESGLASSIGTELNTLTNDLVGDGYKVYRYDVPAKDVTEAGWSTNVTNIKNLVVTNYDSDPSAIWTLFIVGHVPIPYSGLSSPGGHTENFGAHPADWYYADTNSSAWTDTTANDTTGDYAAQHNVPGDGKFDQSTIPSAPEMRVGRIDLRNMPAFSQTEAQLIQQYLNRNHAWRHKQFTVRELGLINSNNNAGLIYRGRPADAHDEMSSFWGTPNNIQLGSWLPSANSSNSSYLFASSSGNGQYAQDIQIGYTTNFASSNLYIPFTSMYGSYYGDWDSAIITNVVLQAPLAGAGYTLANYYRENVAVTDDSSLNAPIGQDLFTLAANAYAGSSAKYFNYGYWFEGQHYQIVETVKGYTTLLGDPTLRVRVVAPPSNPAVTTVGTDYRVTWTPASDSGIVGYHVYRAPTNDWNSFTRLTTNPTSSPYTNASAAGTPYVYMIRTIKYEDSTARSYTNSSQGVTVTSEGQGVTDSVTLTATTVNAVNVVFTGP